MKQAGRERLGRRQEEARKCNEQQRAAMREDTDTGEAQKAREERKDS